MPDLDTIRPVLRALLRSCVDVHPTLAEAEVDADALVVVLGREGVESAIRRLAAEPSEQTAVPDLPPEVLDELERTLSETAAVGEWHAMGESGACNVGVVADNGHIVARCSDRDDANSIASARNALPALLASARRLAEVEAEVARLREQSPGLAADAAVVEAVREWQEAMTADPMLCPELMPMLTLLTTATLRPASEVAAEAAAAERERILELLAERYVNAIDIEGRHELRDAHAAIRAPASPSATADRDRLREALRGLVKAYGVRPRCPDEEYPGCSLLVASGPYGDWLEVWTAALAALEESDG